MATVGFYGVRGSCPCSDPSLRRYGGATACVSVTPGSGAAPVVLDLGTGSRVLGEELLARCSPDQLAAEMPPASGPRSPRLRLAAFVTHLHFDHVQGLPFFGPALRSGTELTVHGPVQAGGSLEDSFAAFVRPPYFPVGLEQLEAAISWRELGDGESVQVGDVKVTARTVPHVGNTLGYRVECDGLAVAYLSDHQQPRSEGPDRRVAEGVLELAAGADLLVHDAQYTDAEFALKAHWGHSTVAYAMEVARAAGVGMVALFHHDPTHDDDMLDQLGREATALGNGRIEVLMASEGLKVRLG